jgi:glutamyl-tRNA reductase
VALRKKIDTIAKKEVEKTLKSLNHLSAKDREAIDKMLKALTNKILHDPTLFLKSNGFGDDKALAINITRKLFNLDE